MSRANLCDARPAIGIGASSNGKRLPSHCAFRETQHNGELAHASARTCGIALAIAGLSVFDIAVSIVSGGKIISLHPSYALARDGFPSHWQH